MSDTYLQETYKYRLDAQSKINRNLKIENDKLQNRLRHADNDLDRMKDLIEKLEADLTTTVKISSPKVPTAQRET